MCHKKMGKVPKPPGWSVPNAPLGLDEHGLLLRLISLVYSFRF